MAAPFPPREQLLIDDAWTVGEGDCEGKPVLVRFRPKLRAIAGHPAFPQRLVVAWDYGDSEIGMPEPEDTEDMDQFEDRLIESLERDNQALLAAVVTHAGLREWIFYTSGVEESIGRVNEEFGGDDPYPLDIALVDDPEWEEYLGILGNCVEGDDAPNGPGPNDSGPNGKDEE